MTVTLNPRGSSTLGGRGWPETSDYGDPGALRDRKGRMGYWPDRGDAMEGTPTFDGPEPTDPDLLPSKDEPHGNLEERRTLREHKDHSAGEATPGNRRKEHDSPSGRASQEDR